MKTSHRFDDPFCAHPQQKRILHVFSTFIAAGPQVRARVLMRALGQEFSHMITAVDGRFDAASDIEPSISFQVVPPPPGKGSLFYAFALWKLVRRLQPDLVLTYNWGAMDAVAACGLPRICPVIHTEDGFGAEESLRLARRRVLSRRVLFKAVQAVVVPSSTLHNIALRQYRTPSNRLHWIPNGVDTAQFRPAATGLDRELREHWKIAPHTCLFGYVGRLGEEKKLDLLLEAFAKAHLSDAALVLVGDGPCRTALQDLVRKLGLQSQVVFAGAAVDPRPYYHALDVFTLSSATEQMPLALLEAMSCGLPAISTGVGDAPLMLCERAASAPIIVPVGNVNGYADSLRRFASDAAMRIRLGLENRRRCLERYTLQAMVAKYESLYRGACGLKPDLRYATTAV